MLQTDARKPRAPVLPTVDSAAGRAVAPFAATCDYIAFPGGGDFRTLDPVRGRLSPSGARPELDMALETLSTEAAGLPAPRAQFAGRTPE